MKNIKEFLEKIDQFKKAIDFGFELRIEEKNCCDCTNDSYTQLIIFKKENDKYLLMDDETGGELEYFDEYFKIYGTKDWEEYKKLVELYSKPFSESEIEKYIIDEVF